VGFAAMSEMQSFPLHTTFAMRLQHCFDRLQQEGIANRFE